MRPLTLHVSALSNAEYHLYTASLDDLATDSIADGTASTRGTAHVRGDDAHYEQTTVGVREARAWLRGRYSGLPASDIDAILKLFCPKMQPTDTLTGGQFFATLRLVIHAESGKGVDQTLAFVQASPKSAKGQPQVLQPSSPPRRPVQAPPSHPDRQKPPLATATPETNPFTRWSEHVAVPAPAPPAEPDPGPVIPQQARHSKISHNPFLARDKHDADKTVPPANASNHGKLPPLPPRKPTLFAAPRRPLEPAPMATTSMAGLVAPAPPGPPLIPIKPTHVMSPLMRQSLEASKHAQSVKRAEEQLDRERVLQVLKTSSSSSSATSSATAPNTSTRTRSLSPSRQAVSKPPNGHVVSGSAGSGSGPGSAGSDGATYIPPLPRRRKPSPPSSTSSTVLSFEQVASATLSSPVGAPSMTRSPPLAPSRDTLGVPGPSPGPSPVPPPTHPHRRPSTSTEPNVNESQSQSPSPSSPRFARSQSATTTSTSPVFPPPPPPQRRKRPESMQLTPTSDLGGELPSFPLPPHMAFSTGRAREAPHVRTVSASGSSFQGGGGVLSRHMSFTHDRGRSTTSLSPTDAVSASPIANIQKTLTHLHMRAQPKLDAVRYKAEAGISRRGYVHHGQLGGLGGLGGAGSRWREEGEEGLMADTRWDAANVDRDPGPDSGPTTDEESSSGEDRSCGDGVRGKTTMRVPTTMGATKKGNRDFLAESDNLKWPMGEGWKPL